jgi:hypothetical protein
MTFATTRSEDRCSHPFDQPSYELHRDKCSYPFDQPSTLLMHINQASSPLTVRGHHVGSFSPDGSGGGAAGGLSMCSKKFKMFSG